MPSSDLVRKLMDGGFLRTHPKDAGQAKKLLSRARRDIATAEANLEIDEEAVYTFAYLGMLRAGRALLFLNGLRPADGRQHRTVVEVAGMLLGRGHKELSFKFEQMRRKRNQFTYEPDLPLGRKETEDALNASRRFVEAALTLAGK